MAGAPRADIPLSTYRPRPGSQPGTVRPALRWSHRDLLPRGLESALGAVSGRDARGKPGRVGGGWRGGGQGQTAGATGIPVWWHVADPVAFFDTVDERNEYLELLTARPDWSFAGPEFPSFDRLIDGLEAVVAAHPRTTFVAVHAGGYAENLSRVGQMLDSYPNFHVDIAARIAQLGRQPRSTRDLLLRHPDRVLFGCDEIPHTGRSYPTHFRFLETADEYFPHSSEDPPLMGRWHISGLNLPDDALRSIYGGNAARLVPRLSLPSAPPSAGR